MTPGTLSEISGEYVDPRMEASFRQERQPEFIRQSRNLFYCSAFFNTLFLATDARFYGDPHFWVAVPARVGVVLASLLALLLLRRVTTLDGLTRVFVGYQIAATAGVSLLVSSHSDLAFFAVIILPAIFYLAAPTPFWLTVTSTFACTLALLAGFLSGGTPPGGTALGVTIGMFMLNAALCIVLSKSNRLRRLEFSATQAERRANQELAASRQDLERIFMAVPIPLVVSERESGRIVRANNAAVRFYGEEAIRNVQVSSVIYADPERRRDLLNELAQSGYVESFEARIRMPDETEREMLLSSTRITIDSQDCLITGGVDISARKAMQAKLEELATLDPLTRALNRSAFSEIGSKEIARARREQTPIAVMMTDLDYFKLINDSFGHAAGDTTLKVFTDLCRTQLRSHDHLGRLGGEEFAIVLPNTTREEAAQVAERLRFAVENVKVSDAYPGLCVTVSIGVSEVDAEVEYDLSSALARADLALYAAKMRGRNKVVEAGEAEESEDDQCESARPIMSARA